MTIKDKSEKGLLLNITGDGKGKTTSALGITLRALGWGWRTAFFQFLKNDAETGEKKFFAAFQDHIIFEQLGKGFSWQKGDHKAEAEQAWKTVEPFLTDPDGRCRLVVLDELNVAIALGYLDAKTVAEVLSERRKDLNVVVTGRNAAKELLDISDLVSNIGNVRHPFDKGISARKGIDF